MCTPAVKGPAPVACGATAPACNGACPPGQVCGNTGPFSGCGCLAEICTAPTACGDGPFPTCAGECPTGQVCSALTLAPSGNPAGCACATGTVGCNSATGSCNQGSCPNVQSTVCAIGVFGCTCPVGE
jgi:hypothetical protein